MEDIVISKVDTIEKFKAALAFINDSKKFDFSLLNRNWEYSYAPDKLILFIIEHNNEIVGFWSHFALTLKSSQGEIKTSMGENVYFIEEYRGKGLDTKLFYYAMSELSRNGLGLFFTFTHIYILLVRKFNAIYFKNSISLTNVQINYLHLDSFTKEFKFMPALFKYIKKFFVFLHNYSFLYINNSNGKNKDYLIKKDDYNHNTVSQIYQRIEGKHGVFTYLDIDKDFYDWRVRCNPTYRYCTYYIYEKDVPKGYAIIFEKDKSLGVVDFICIDKTTSVLLFKKICYVALKKRLKYVKLYLNKDFEINKPLFNFIAKLYPRFNDTIIPPMVINPLAINREIMSNKQQMHITGLWKLGYDF